MKRFMRVWRIDEGSPGHSAQVDGFLAALRRRGVEMESRMIDGRGRLSGIQRQCLRVWLRVAGVRFPVWSRKRLFPSGMPPVDEDVPDLLVSSGGKSIFTGMFLAWKTGAPFVFIGERKPYPSRWFHTVFTPSPRERGARDIQIELIPTGINPSVVEEAALEESFPEGELWTMIVGGASRSHRFSRMDWVSIARGMNRLARRQGIRWLVTTSRRTGAEAERALRANLDADGVADAVWWSERPAKRLRAFLGGASRVFVTQDSVTMVSEAVASGRPTTVVQPAKVRFSRQSFLPAYMDRLERLGAITRVKSDVLVEAPPPPQGAALSMDAVEDRMARAILKRMD